MKKISLKRFEIISAVIAILIGMLLHFTYEWSGNNQIVGIFSAINESVWEHLKILFFPMLLTTIIGCFYYKDIPNYLCTKTKGILLALLFIVVFFYTYSGIIGNHYPIVDIISFVVAIIIGEINTYNNLKNKVSCNNTLAIFILSMVSLSFILFTFKTPHIGIFKDPNNSYDTKIKINPNND